MRKATPETSGGTDDGDGGRARGAAPASDDAAERVREVILSGRRYRLLPVDERSAPGPAPRAPSPALVLTARELQIVTLVADGLVNKQVAAALRISEWTVSTHLRRIYAKLGVDTRAAMVSRCAHALASAAGAGPSTQA